MSGKEENFRINEHEENYNLELRYNIVFFLMHVTFIMFLDAPSLPFGLHIYMRTIFKSVIMLFNTGLE